MWDFTIVNKITGEERGIFGYSSKDAFKRYPALNPEEWTVVDKEYID